MPCRETGPDSSGGERLPEVPAPGRGEAQDRVLGLSAWVLAGRKACAYWPLLVSGFGCCICLGLWASEHWKVLPGTPLGGWGHCSAVGC